ncbi:hypothetical protein DLC02_20955, partial [Salmonella enterica subsp. enterica serovar Chittagong]|nr:hypothetical protein [Salmonella enterica subsp. enterica serovar Chittagong]EBY5131145.1 hypothetical protein [Salmonella enterica subsp. enterica serovar Brazzaville]ECI3851126.1 hypothetical protein [Salmonella enterica subsp. enterica]
EGPIERLGLFAFIFLWKKLSDNDADAFYIWFIPFILQVAYVLATLAHPSHIVIYAPGDSLPCRL